MKLGRLEAHLSLTLNRPLTRHEKRLIRRTVVLKRLSGLSLRKATKAAQRAVMHSVTL